jgi:hypothetical protein
MLCSETKAQAPPTLGRMIGLHLVMVGCPSDTGPVCG